MGRVITVLIATLLGCTVSFAQTMTPGASPAIGMTSPLGMPGSQTFGQPTGIPLGATEINPGGLSPTAPPVGTATCIASSSAGVSGTQSTFDGGGMGACPTGSTGMGSVAGAGTSSGTIGMGMMTAPRGTIPLGSTELNNGGVSPLIAVAPPISTSIPCPGTPGITDSTTPTTGTLGMSSAC